jgi:hypothetical protein
MNCGWDFPDAAVTESTVRNHVCERNRQMVFLRRETVHRVAPKPAVQTGVAHAGKAPRDAPGTPCA